MATARRESIVDAVVSALTSITVANGYETTVATVHTSVPENWSEPERGSCPALLVLDLDAVETPSAIWGASSDYDMRSEMQVLVACAIFSETSSFKSARNDLIMDIKKAMFTHASVWALLLDITQVRITNIGRGMLPKFNHFELEFTVHFDYDHTVGG